MNQRPVRFVKSVVLAYSGGLDTSIILAWLKETYRCRVIAFVADVGQPEDLGEVRAKALATGADHVIVEDLRESFLADYAFPTLAAGGAYENGYLLGTALARPIIARRQAELALALGADALCHGATGKGNDQVRFELAYAAFAPELTVIAPWREWNIRSREEALAYASMHHIPVDTAGGKLLSRDANLWHTSHEGGPLEDPAVPPEESFFVRSVGPDEAPAMAARVTIGIEAGRPVSVDGEMLDPVALLTRLNELAGAYGIGRVDIVENRAVGIKSRGVYETPGGTLLAMAMRELESLTLDRDTLHYKQQVGLRFAELVYDGLWFTPLREALQCFVTEATRAVSGRVMLKLHRGVATVESRESPMSLYDPSLGSFVMGADYEPRDAQGYMRLKALPIKARARLQARAAELSSGEAVRLPAPVPLTRPRRAAAARPAARVAALRG